MVMGEPGVDIDNTLCEVQLSPIISNYLFSGSRVSAYLLVRRNPHPWHRPVGLSSLRYATVPLVFFPKMAF